MKPIDFLKELTEDRIRKEIQNIHDSYSHPWDILAELCQNSVDAIITHVRNFGALRKHRIGIQIDGIRRSLTVIDTGIGFAPQRFAQLLAPHGTDKAGQADLIGEKGVGLTYTIFTANSYAIRSKSTSAHIEGHIDQATLWRIGKVSETPVFVVDLWEEASFDPQNTFTEVVLGDVEEIYEETDDIFHQNLATLTYILRTKTAIGYLNSLFENKPLACEVKLKFTDLNAVTTEVDLKPEYMLPEEFLDKVVSLDDFKATASTLDDQQKVSKLMGRAVFKRSSVVRSGRKIDYYALFAPSRNVWKEISEKNDFLVTDAQGRKVPQYEPGIFVATKGMPTGVRLEPPVTGFSGYWPNFYMIFQDNSIVFDLGRKAVPNRTRGTLREIAAEVFNEFIPYVKYATTDPAVAQASVATIQVHEKFRRFEALKKLPGLSFEGIGYLKHPAGQEAAVVAIFHELVGAKILKGYYTLGMGYRHTYDLWGIYRIDKHEIATKYSHLADAHGMIDVPIIIEFKYRAEDILSDFETRRKHFIDIDLIVSWDLDAAVLAKQGVTTDMVSDAEAFFFGTNYKLVWPGAYNLGNAGEKPLLALRRFVENFKQGNS